MLDDYLSADMSHRVRVGGVTAWTGSMTGSWIRWMDCSS
jgi:hypothetical protein